MAITNAWTDPDTLEFGSTEARAADLNAVLGNQKWLHGRPRFTLAHSADQPVESGKDVTLTWDTKIEDVGGWWDPGSPSVAVVPEDGVYLLAANLLWDGTAGGNQRKARFARNGALIRGTTAPGVSFAEQALFGISSLSAGQALSVSMYHNDPAADHSILRRSSPVWRSPLFFGVWLMPYIPGL